MLAPTIQRRQHRWQLCCVTHAGAPAVDAKLDQYLEAPDHAAAAAKEFTQMLYLLRAIDQAKIFKARVLEQARDQSHILFPHKLVGHQNPAHAVVVGNQRLVRGSERDTPGTRLQLKAKQLGGHRGLAMGRQLEPVGGNELLHPMQVMAQSLVAQDGCRQAQVFAQQVPTQLDDLARLHSLLHPSQTLVEGLDGGLRLGGL